MAPSTTSTAPGSLPTGTVTFLFTDIEGSTRLLEELRGEYATLLGMHRDLLRACFAEWNGVEVDTQGDSFFVAFPRAADALGCAVQAQRAIDRHRWPGGIQLRVRMGIHTGEPALARTGYVGMDVHRTARVAAAGHGGQILVSDVTRALIDELPPESRLVDLGEHRLKDVRQPIRLHQLSVASLTQEFPPLRTLDTGDEPPQPGSAPFMGLQAYDEQDAALFFGREEVTERLVSRMRRERFLAIVGASGSGKSSIARAGLAPAVSAMGGWRTITITPGPRPLEALAFGLSEAARSVGETARLIDDLLVEPRSLHLAIERLLGKGREGGHVLLLVDQLEELFSLARDRTEREAFAANLMTAAHARAGPTHVVVTLRADFYGHLAGHDDLRDAVAGHQEYIAPMSAAELRRAIEEPALAGDWEFAPGLVDLILRDVGNEPGALPLLSHALLESWHHRRGRAITLKAYAESGGVHGAIARTADRVFNAELSAEEREMARDIFLRLTELGEGAEDTRRRVALGELVPDDPDEAASVHSVLSRLAERRLITMAESTVEVAHEALIREWPQLREWLGQDREGLRTHRHLTEAATEWLLLDRDDGALYRGARLVQATDWARDHATALNEHEREFLATSQAAAAREEADREERQRRELEAAERLAEAERTRAEEASKSARALRWRALLLTGALAVAAVLAGAAVMFGGQAQESFANAESQRLAAEANTIMQLGESSELAALLALRGLNARYTQQADAALQRASRAQFSDRIFTVPDRVDAVAVSPDGRLLAGGSIPTAYVWDMETGERVATLDAGDGVVGAVFAPGSSLLALSGRETVQVWDVAAGTRLWSTPNTAHAEQVAFTADGANLAVPGAEGAALLDAETGEIVESFEAIVGGAVLMPDEQLAMQVEGTEIVLRSLSTGDQIQRFAGHEDEVTASVLMSDGRMLASNSYDKTARVWDVETGELIHTMRGHTEILFENAVSPDGTMLLTGSLDTTARLWDLETGEELRRFNGHTASVYTVAFTPDARYAVTGSRDGTIRLWDVDAPAERDTLTGPDSFMYGLDFSPDGERLVAGNANGTTQIWDLATRRVVHVLTTEERVDDAAFSPDGKYVLVSPSGSVPKLWSADSGEVVYELADAEPTFAMAADFSADSALMLAPLNEGKTGVWSVAENRLVQSFETAFESSGELSPDGSRAFTYADLAGETNGKIWDVASGDLVAEFEQPGGILGGDFAPDGRTVAAVGRDGIGRIWDIETGEVVQDFTGHTNISWRAVFSPDGQYLFTTNQDRSARMWDVETGEQVRYFPGHANSAVAGIAASPDGTTVAIGSYDGAVQLSPTALDDLVESVCSRLRRDFTDLERTIYGITDDRPTCD